MELLLALVNHIAPSGPAVMPDGADRAATTGTTIAVTDAIAANTLRHALPPTRRFVRPRVPNIVVPLSPDLIRCC